MCVFNGLHFACLKWFLGAKRIPIFIVVFKKRFNDEPVLFWEKSFWFAALLEPCYSCRCHNHFILFSSQVLENLITSQKKTENQLFMKWCYKHLWNWIKWNVIKFRDIIAGVCVTRSMNATFAGWTPVRLWNYDGFKCVKLHDDADATKSVTCLSTLCKSYANYFF